MNSDINIRVRSSNPVLSQLSPTGVTLTYGINTLPVASLDLPPRDMYIICDFEEHRRSDIIIEVATPNGCTVFNGLVDGLSSTGSFGGMSSQLIVKSWFQNLAETYARMPGFQPGPVDIMRRIPVVNYKYAGGQDAQNWLNAAQSSLLASLDSNLPAMDFIIAAAKIMLTNQKEIRDKFISEKGIGSESLINILEQYTDEKFDLALQLLDSIDTSYATKMLFNAASDARLAQIILPSLANSSNSILDWLISTFQLFGCNLIVANDTAYVVPDGGFIKLPHVANFSTSIPLGTRSQDPNIAYPADYDNYIFNDNGYKDISAVYVVSDANMTYLTPRGVPDLGEYRDPEARGGVLACALPQFALYNLNAVDARYTKKHQTHAAGQNPALKDKVSMQQALEAHKAQGQEISNVTYQLNKSFFDNWAQIRYMQTKYMDRVGSISSFFNPVWAPGAAGIIYTRQPGAFIDMFVTGVTHRFSVSPPSGGEARTSISFNCGRFGKRSTGVDSIFMFNFGAQDSFEYAADFVKNTWGK